MTKTIAQSHQFKMENLRHLTDQINVFVQFFQSVNCLFFQLKWLEENIVRSSNGLLLTVIGIVLFCIFVYFIGEEGFITAMNNIGISDVVAHTIYQFIFCLYIDFN